MKLRGQARRLRRWPQMFEKDHVSAYPNRNVAQNRSQVPFRLIPPAGHEQPDRSPIA